jgi:phenylpropionate dioxygenase-like ring-hydroxylating dioxygenase large terminal subunit
VNTIERAMDVYPVQPAVGRIDKSEYISRQFAEAERTRLWPRVWQVACREEELPSFGSFVTYDILDESVIIVRTAEDTIKAYNNACLHRGRRLTEGCGRTSRLVCRFHGWKWNLDGTLREIVDAHNWQPPLQDSELHLREFKVATWGGFVFVNLSGAPEPFESFIDPIPAYLDCLEFDRMRFRWYVTLDIEANWKTAIEAFTESYHVVQTHSQLAPFYDDRSTSHARGKHAQLMFPSDYVPGFRAGGTKGDARQMVLEYVRQQAEDIQSIFTDRDYQAASRVLTEVPPEATYMEAMEKAIGFMAEAAIAVGAGFPAATAEQFFNAGFDWTLFPNMVCVFSATSAIWFRSRPRPDNDPDHCLFDMWSLERMPLKTAPPIVRQHYPDWREFKGMPVFLIDDFKNIPMVHRGMKTQGFQGPRLNPVQESAITNLHRVLHEYVDRR